MKTFSFVALAALMVWLDGASAFGQMAGQHGVFKVTATIPVIQVDRTGADDKLVTKTLTTNNLINLAQGRPIAAKFDTKHEVLAADVTFEDDGSVAPLSRLVIYDPAENGAAGVNVVVGTLSEIKFTTAYTGGSTKGVGVGKGTLAATTLGTPAENAIIEATFTGNGSGSGGHIFDKQEKVTATASSAFQGTCKFRFKDPKGNVIVWDGFVLKGAFKLSGKPIGNYLQP